jgi:hypothetical protein
MAQRISRAKRTSRASRFNSPVTSPPVLRVLYLVFNEGYSGDVDLAAEAIRLPRQLAGHVHHEEVADCSRSCCSTTASARRGPHRRQPRAARPSRTAACGHAADRRGRRVLQAGPRPRSAGRVPGPGRHRRAPRRRRTVEETDWVQIVEWYDELVRLTDSPVVRLNRAVARGRGRRPARRPGRARGAGRRRCPAHRGGAHLHERDGDWRRRPGCTPRRPAGGSAAERDHLTRQAARLNATGIR